MPPQKQYMVMDMKKMGQIHARVEATVKDARAAELLKPWYHLACKRLTFHDGWRAALRKGTGVALAVTGLFAITNYVLTPKVDLAWLRGEAEAAQMARASGRPMVVDFMADWCLPCKEMELQVFSRPEVAREMSRFTLLRVDLSEEDDALAAVKRKYGAETLPAIRIVSPAGAIVARTDQQLSAERFLGLLASVP